MNKKFSAVQNLKNKEKVVYESFYEYNKAEDRISLNSQKLLRFIIEQSLTLPLMSRYKLEENGNGTEIQIMSISENVHELFEEHESLDKNSVLLSLPKIWNGLVNTCTFFEDNFIIFNIVEDSGVLAIETGQNPKFEFLIKHPLLYQKTKDNFYEVT